MFSLYGNLCTTLDVTDPKQAEEANACSHLCVGVLFFFLSFFFFFVLHSSKNCPNKYNYKNKPTAANRNCRGELQAVEWGWQMTDDAGFWKIGFHHVIILVAL